MTKAAALASLALLAAASPALAQERLHFTYLWHLEQPIYWPERQTSGADRYERAWESIRRKDAGAAHPADDLRGIFGLDDRRAVYQFRIKDAIGAIGAAPEAGAQVTYSGGLIENISSLGNANQLGYGPGWFNDFRTARSWYTSAAGASKPRLDVVLFSFHHALLPLLDDAAVRKEIQAYKRIYADAWGSAVPRSQGFFPSEMAFSTRLIPILQSEGVTWSFVSAEKVSRACADFPVVYGSGGINCDPPNRADQLNANASNYYRVSISRGCAPAEAVPRAFVPARARYIDPSTGAASEIIVVPCSQHMGWKDGYAPLGIGDFNAVQSYANTTGRPMLAVLAHDGDNAWGGGYSYYMESLPNNVNTARGAGYIPTVVEKYLADHPVPASDIVHVEQGAWVNADGCFGSPQMLNWNWPLLNASGQIDIDNGWHEDARNWAVITANTNRVETAEQIWRAGGGNVDIGKIVYPDAATNNVERAWHYFLGGLNSGFMYYGTALDMEVKASVSGNRAMDSADPVIGNAAADTTAPTVWDLQRHPWNPGSVNFGPQYGYRQSNASTDFKVYTFAYDVSGISSVVLKYRVDADGQNPLNTTENETYAGGPGVGAWQTVPMTRRVFPAANVYNNPTIDFYVMPRYIADQYTANVTGLRNQLADYYVEATDSRGHTKRSPIHHVYVGDGTGTPPGGGTVVTINPALPTGGNNVTITYDPANRPLANAPLVRLHYGFNGWTNVSSPDPAMTLVNGKWVITVPVQTDATQLDLVFNNGSNTWDNNGGADWHFACTPGGPPPDRWTMDGLRDTQSVRVALNGGMNLWAGLKGDILYLATNDAGEGNDHFIYLARTPGTLRAANWAKAGQIAGWDAFLADENNNDYESWFDTNAGVATEALTAANGGVLEGTINLRQELGLTPGQPLPDRIHLAVGVYSSADNGPLVPSAQVPPSINSDGNIDAGEFVSVRLCEITARGPSCCTADFNRDGFLDFFDFDDFTTAFEAGNAAADFNNDGFLDFFDFDDFVLAFDAGC
jgi:hypothetical protein